MPDNIKVYRLHGWKKVVLYPAVLCMKLFANTLRIRLSERTKKFSRTHNYGAIMAFWHQNLFLIWKLNSLLKCRLPMYGLISPSNDGAWLSAFFSLMGIGSVRGSSGKLGLPAINELRKKLKQGANVAITPDGPLGPAKKFKNGISVLALRSKVDVFLFAIEYESFWTLNTWDKFRIPKPFSKIFIDYEKFPYEDIQNLTPTEASLRFERALQLMEISQSKNR
jgi:lysophospholipid acyltransferase (LPLAT)-like uncharacterized protein